MVKIYHVCFFIRIYRSFRSFFIILSSKQESPIAPIKFLLLCNNEKLRVHQRCVCLTFKGIFFNILYVIAKTFSEHIISFKYKKKQNYKHAACIGMYMWLLFMNMLCCIFIYYAYIHIMHMINILTNQQVDDELRSFLAYMFVL